MVLNKSSKDLSVACLLLTCFQAAAANSPTHSGEACATDERKMQQLQQFASSDELNFSPSHALSLLQKRAQEGATGTHNAENLDTTYQRKGGSTNDAFKSKKRKTPWTWTEPWTTRWPGCCKGERDAENGKLFGGNMTSLAACKQKCRTFRNCGSVEYGWKDGNTQWCFIWADTQTCKKRDKDCVKSVPGNGRGVANYLYTAPQITKDDLAMAKWNVVGSGCCAGPRDESNGKLYADKEKNLDACKARCIAFHNCGLVEYGWQAGDPQWCYIWDNSQTCQKIDPDCTESVLDSGVGAQIHRYSKVVVEKPVERTGNKTDALATAA